MKKIFTASLVFCAILCGLPTLACSQEMTGIVTGEACSIQQLNNLEKNNNIKETTSPNSKREKNLRPIRTNPEITMPEKTCIIGNCLYRTLLEK